MIQPLSVPLVSALLVAVGLIFSPATVLARDPPAVAKLVQMNKRALDDYDNLEWKSAKRRLLEAIAEAKKSSIETHPIVARTYLHLGAVYVVGLHDRNAGVQCFVRALQIDPEIRVATAMETPAISAAFSDAQAQVAKGGGATVTSDDDTDSDNKKSASNKKNAEESKAPPARKGKGQDEPDLPMNVAALDCPNTDDVARGQSAVIRCAVSPALKVFSTVLFYRVPGAEEFSTVAMKKSPKGWFVGEIPKDVTEGKSVQFYVEGRDRNGKPIVANGRGGSPNLMLVRDPDEAEADADSKAHPAAAAEPEENPLENLDQHGVVRRTVDKESRGPRFPSRKLWIGLGAGSGFGYAKGDGLEVRKDLQSKFSPGLGWAGLGQLAPEFGLHVTKGFALALQGRIQWIEQSGKDKRGASGAAAVLLRMLFFTAPRSIRLYGGPTVGYGNFRFIFTPDETDPGAKDSVLGGPIIAGLSGGLSYAVVRALSVNLEINGLVGFPTTSAVADLNLGLQVNFY
ncbi:MAG TPA: hypothetical protein VH374_00395 [Polyangia bacterium]|jgi:hypothetical protein|nr:hypothetical protein [Polyangia bacterium]